MFHIGTNYLAINVRFCKFLAIVIINCKYTKYVWMRMAKANTSENVNKSLNTLYYRVWNITLATIFRTSRFYFELKTFNDTARDLNRIRKKRHLLE